MKSGDTGLTKFPAVVGGGWPTFDELGVLRSRLRVPHPCVVCKGGQRCGVRYLILLCTRDRTRLRRHFRLPPFAKKREGRGTHCVGSDGEIKSLGHPSVIRQAENGRHQVRPRFFYGEDSAAVWALILRSFTRDPGGGLAGILTALVPIELLLQVLGRILQFGQCRHWSLEDSTAKSADRLYRNGAKMLYDPNRTLLHEHSFPRTESERQPCGFQTAPLPHIRRG